MMFGDKMLNNLRLRGKFIAIFFTIFIVAILAVGYMGFSKTDESLSKLVISKDKTMVSDVVNDINTFLESVPTDLYFLSSSHSFKKYLLWESIGEVNSSYDRKKEAMDTFLSFIDSKKYFYKIRFLDLKGDEQISIQYDKATNVSSILEKKELQNKKNKKYFKIPLGYNKKDLYVSDLDLNKEFGRNTYPYLPVVRFSMPIIDDTGIKQGIFVLNIYADYFLRKIKKYEKALEKEHRSVFLVDSQGYYLFNKDEKKLWGKDLAHKSSLSRDNLDFFRSFSGHDEGMYDDGDNLYTYKKIYLSKLDKSDFLVLYTVTDKSFAFKDLEKFKLVFILVVLFVSLLVLYLINTYVTQVTQPLSKISEYLRILSLGKIPENRIKYKKNDEIGMMLESMHLLSENFSSTIKQVKLIAKGDLSKDIHLLSEEDSLGIAINDMTSKLRKNQDLTELNNWFNAGVGGLSKILSAEMDIESLSNETISFICRYINLGKGVFYTFDKQKKVLNLTGSFMHTKRDALGNQYLLGEGSIGQVAKEKKPILLTKVQSSINIAFEDLAVESCYTFPLVFEEELYGVIEVMSLNEIDEKTQDFLMQVQEIISSILYSVLQRNKVQELLSATHESQKKLQIQNEEIQESNSQMEEQQQQLEEANTQMEEQQQQLEEANTQMEEQQLLLEDKNQKLIKSQKDLEKRAEDLALSSKYKSEFLANMSHELRTPLNSIILLSDMLQENRSEHLDKEEVKKASVINTSGNELLRLVNDVLDLSKIEAGKMELIVDDFNSSELCNEFQEQFEHGMNQKNLELIIVDEYKDRIINDKDRLSQVIRNLMSNSLKFTKEGSITLKIEKSNNNGVKISVTDTGIGVAKAKAKTIFEAFQQADGSTNREYGGTGLGLSISKELADMMSGEIFLSSQEGVGSVFSIVIPNLFNNEAGKIEDTYKEEISQKPLREDFQISDDRDVITQVDKPFLIIEDDTNFAMILKEKINIQNEYALIANTGRQGLLLAKKYPIKGVMLDLGLPDINGIDVLKEFKTDVMLRRIPVYIISGDQKENLSKRNGAIGFATKPIKSNDILSIIEKINHFNDKEVKDLLVVADNKKHAETLLESVQDSTVKTKGVSTVKEAIFELKRGIYDGVIIELQLKEGSGYEICEYIKQNKLDTPIIIYTSKELDSKEETLLRQYTDSIIIQTSVSEKRLVEEVDLFLHRVKVDTGKKEEYINDINLNDKKILVVDDDIRNIYVLSEVLNSKGAQVITANNGQEAVDILRQNPHMDLVLMDIMMPIMDGYEATKIIKSDKKLRDIPVIALTAKAMPKDREIVLEAGCDDYISKPLKMDILIGIVKGWLNKK